MRTKKGGSAQQKPKSLTDNRSTNSHSEEIPSHTETSDGKTPAKDPQGGELARLAKTFAAFVNDYNKSQSRSKIEKPRKPKARIAPVRVSHISDLPGTIIRDH